MFAFTRQTFHPRASVQIAHYYWPDSADDGFVIESWYNPPGANAQSDVQARRRGHRPESQGRSCGGPARPTARWQGSHSEREGVRARVWSHREFARSAPYDRHWTPQTSHRQPPVGQRWLADVRIHAPDIPSTSVSADRPLLLARQRRRWLRHRAGGRAGLPRDLF